MTWAFNLYILAIGAVSAFAISHLITIPLLLASVVLLLAFIENRIWIDRRLLQIFVLFSIPALISAVVNVHQSYDKTIGHLLSYLISPLLFYTIVRIGLANESRTNFQSALKFGLFASFLYVLFEFSAANFGIAKFVLNIPRPVATDYQPLVSGLLIRTRGFAEESAHYMLYAGVCYFILRHYGKSSLLTTFLFGASALLSFGVASWIALITAAAGSKASMTIIRKRVLANLVATLFAIAIACAIFWDFVSSFVLNQFIVKTIGLGESDRADRFKDNLEVFISADPINLIFGLGPGYYDIYNISSVVSLPGLAMFQTGAWGFASLMVLYFIYHRRAQRVSSDLKFALIFSAVCYVSISNYWLPWLWMLLAVIDHEDTISHNGVENWRS